MVTEVIIPAMDQAGGDFVLAKWLKREGDVVYVGDVLCEIETSKASVEIPAEVKGVLRQILIPEGPAIPSLTVIALIADAHEPLPTIDPFYRVKGLTPLPQPPLPAPDSSRQERGGARGEVIASPRAKKLAAEHHVDLTTIVGSGPDGRIVEDDVQKAIKQR